ncbi:MAG TPA: VOC family protein, partial [Alphaproteobacteria bacterium]|nr:VOC family protein [Alphaproteobacteria bacterium]
ALSLDHIAHFVPDIAQASRALERLGFALTPFSLQHHRTAPDAPLVPAGSGNRCAMLRQGYLEFLTPTSDTPVAERMRTAMARYVGQHLICFGTSESLRIHRHLAESGFDPLPSVALQRQIGTADGGEGTARFTVLRVPPEAMPEGRVQVVEHHTPELLWQERWLVHPNGAAALLASIVCVADVGEAAARFARFAEAGVRREGPNALVETRGHGRILIIDAATARAGLGLAPPCLPWIAGVVLRVDDVQATLRCLERAGNRPARRGDAVIAHGQAELGGVFVFTAAEDAEFLPG